MSHLPPAGSPAANVLIVALTEYTDNQRDWLEGEDEPDPTEVENTRVAQLILDRLVADFVSAATGEAVQP